MSFVIPSSSVFEQTSSSSSKFQERKIFFSKQGDYLQALQKKMKVLLNNVWYILCWNTHTLTFLDTPFIQASEKRIDKPKKKQKACLPNCIHTKTKQDTRNQK